MYEKYYKRLAKIAESQPLEETPQHDKSAEKRVGFFQRQTEQIRQGYKRASYEASGGDMTASTPEDDFAARSMQEMRLMAERLKAELGETTDDSPYGPLKPVEYTGKETNALAYAIKSVESSFNYQALGPVIESGQYKGERALGAYQVMPGNLPSWSKAALGRVVSPKEFLENPEIQDKIFLHQMEQNIAKYGTVEDAVSVWFTGRPYEQARKQGANDGYNTIDQYMQKFQVAYNEFQRDTVVR